jgi:ribokinase
LERGRIEVIGIGGCNIDYVAFTSIIPGKGEKVIATTHEIHGGGVCANTLTQLARLGVKCGWIGKIGDDNAGRMLMEIYDKEGIDYSQAIVVKTKSTSFTWIIVDEEGDRTIIVFPNVGAELTVEDINERCNYIKTAKIFHSEILQMPITPLLRAAEICRESGVLVSFDLDVPPDYLYRWKFATEEELMRMISLSDLFIPCKPAVSALIEEEDFEKAAKKLLDLGPKIVAITLGEKGCALAYKTKANNVKSAVIPAFQVNTIDTTGAGDAFHGGFIYGLLKNWDLKKAAIFANACAALKCTRKGARSSPALNEVEAFLEYRGIKF